MPTYGYACSSCSHEEDRFERISTDPKTEHPCPKCGDPMLRQIGAGAAFNAGNRVSYPHYNPQLPIRPGEKLGQPNVMSPSHERDIIAGKYGQQYEKNQV